MATEEGHRTLTDSPDDVCATCGAPLDDGEGWDGFCGTHADLREKAGYWT